jgi:protein regulator of cytokinesis 1
MKIPLFILTIISDVYSDALLAAHEAELERLQCLKEQRLPILNLIEKHKSLIRDREELSASSQDASRLMMKGQKGEKRDPTRLLREEKMRKRIAKDLPKVEVELKKVLENYDQEYGRPFLVLGEDYLDEIAAAQARAPPPRSKTPSGPSRSHSQTQPKATAPVKSAPQSQLRSKTPTNFTTMRGNPLSQSTAHKTNGTMSKGATSPSRIPARPPLSSTHGNKSPERLYQTMGAKPKAMGPPRLPPPKMQDLFLPPQQNTPTPYSRAPIELERSASIVRQTQPEDPYGDDLRGAAHSRNGYYAASTSTRSYASSAASSVENNPPHDAASMYSMSSYGTDQRSYAHAPPAASRPQSRQISQQSTVSVASSGNGASVVSGSENWETFDEGASEEDAANAYHARLQAQQGRNPGYAPMPQKRVAPAAEGGWHGDLQGKRLRNEQAY